MELPRLQVICDYPEEGWPSMDLVAEMLLRELRERQADRVRAVRVCPPFRRRLSRLPLLGRLRAAFNADRLLNRFRDYPRYLRSSAGGADWYHVCDHTYAHLLHALPAGRAGAFCHDLDAFRCLLEPKRERRPRWFRALARRILTGLQKAAAVFHLTQTVRDQIEQQGLIDPARLVHAPPGVALEFTPEPANGTASVVSGLLRPGERFLLHVGSCIPRKRIDVLLEVFAGLRRRRFDLRLVQVGGVWTEEQRRRIERLGIGPWIVQRRGIDRASLADLYRRAALLLQTSEGEGFGIPVIEALACGCSVAASDLPVLREAGGPAAVYCPVGEVEAWVAMVSRLLDGSESSAVRAERVAWASRFSWRAHAETILDGYARLVGGAKSGQAKEAARP
jgi:glycosyltransferase involved in cell wall biosynthesis